MRVLITGGAGFVGSHLAARLLAEGNTVTVIDDLSTGAWRNIASLEGQSGFRAVIADMNDASKPFGEVADELEQIGQEIGVVIRCQREEIFDSMHRI